MEQLSTQVSAETVTRKNTGAMLPMRSVPRGYKKDKEDRLSWFSFEKPACQDMNLGAEELN
jgi:hypothetical protein